MPQLESKSLLDSTFMSTVVNIASRALRLYEMILTASFSGD